MLVGTGYRGLTVVGASEGRDPAGGHTAMKGLCTNRETRAGGCPGAPGYGYPQPLSATASTGCGAISGIFSLTGGPLDEAGKAPLRGLRTALDGGAGVDAGFLASVKPKAVP